MSPPNALRSSNAPYPRIGQEMLPAPDLTDLQIELSNSVHEVHIRNLASPDVPFTGTSPEQEFIMRPGELLRVDELVLSFALLVTGWEAVAGNREDESYGHLVPHYFHADLSELPKEDLESLTKELAYTPSLSGQRNSLNLEFTFSTGESKAQDPQILGAWLEDSWTGRTVNTGYGSQFGSKTMTLEFQLTTWPIGPVELVVDLAHGEPRPHRMDPSVGVQWSEGPFATRLLMVQDGDQSGFFTSYDGSNKAMRLSWKDAKPDRPECVSIWWVTPGASRVPLFWRALGDEGILPGRGWSGSGFIRVQSFGCRVEDLRAFEVMEYPKVDRIRMKLPRLPHGLPENEGLDNLFDLRVPGFRGDYWELRRTLENLLQMKLTGFSSRPSLGHSWRLDVKNVTVRELMEELIRASQPASGNAQDEIQVEVDAEKFVVQVVPPWHEQVLSDFRAMLRKWF